MIRPWPMIAPTMFQPVVDNVDKVLYMVGLICYMITLVFVTVIFPIAIHFVHSVVVVVVAILANVIIALFLGTVPNVDHR